MGPQELHSYGELLMRTVCEFEETLRETCPKPGQRESARSLASKRDLYACLTDIIDYFQYLVETTGGTDSGHLQRLVAKARLVARSLARLYGVSVPPVSDQ